LSELIDGASMDVEGVDYRTFDDLVVYCRRVGGTIGRLSLGVFGATDKGEHSMSLADDLGVAFQLTNILRDVSEDLADGRLYLPREDLDRFGCAVENGTIAGDFTGLARFEAARAEEWYDRGLNLLPLLDRSSSSCVSAMAGIYRRLLRRIEREPESVLGGRASSGWGYESRRGRRRSGRDRGCARMRRRRCRCDAARGEAEARGCDVLD
jgi:phytoene synthase